MRGFYMNLNKILVTFLTLIIFSSSLLADVKVKGYYRKDGTYVQPHYRSNPDGNFYNNWSTSGNVNPYTGEYGIKTLNSNKEKVYTPSTVKDLNIPYTTSYSSNSSKKNTKLYSYSTSLDNFELTSKINSSQRLKKLGFTGDTSNLSLIDMLDLESRIQSSKRLKNLGFTGDTSNFFLIDMLDLESRIQSSKRLKNLGFTGDTSNFSL
ncbi:hypothetical protein F994_01643, partial [Acinetobacter bohemicus ANC 3994]